MFENLSRFYYNSGLQLARKDQISEAVEHLLKALSYDSNNIEAWNLAGLCYYRLGKYKTAECCWSRSVDKSPAESNAVGYLTDLRQTLQDTDKHFTWAASLCRQGKYGQAAGVLNEEVCSRFDLSAALLNYLGVLRLLEGKTGAAVRCWANVLTIDKSNASARLYLKSMESRLDYKLLSLKEKLFKRKWQR
ncbi:MAG: tetratricopeptide repeat protein [Dethiobacter sp.]|jgi:tetratricopeptide (TPR) repeat protein|nr:tetratricopeptide repeat protein [Dethiobacter sp.]